MKRFNIKEDDVINIDKYISERPKIKKEISQIKKFRRIPVGPYATFYFECYDTMIYQVQEMLYIERGGIEQMKDELRAYNPLVPKGKELVATLMFEIDNEFKRKEFLNSVGGIEEETFIQVGEQKITSRPEQDTDRTNEEGKASSVHFLHFDFTEKLIKEFVKDESVVLLGFSHKNYKHLSELSLEAKIELKKDFDI
tara:strand:- start:86 stop:676 length:591 start_codon:yes stop_codon:yes gene_type:complete